MTNINIEKEIISLLSVLSKLNPGIPFKYDIRGRKIVADVTNKRETIDISRINTPSKGSYTFNSTFGGKMEAVLSTDKVNVKIAEISVDKCNLSDSKREYYSTYCDYHTGDTYQEPVLEKIRNIVKLPNGSTSPKYTMGRDNLDNLIAKGNSEEPLTKNQEDSLIDFKLQFPKDREESDVIPDTTERREESLNKDQRIALDNFKAQLSNNNVDSKENRDITLVATPGVPSTKEESDVRFDSNAGIFVPVKVKTRQMTWFDKIAEALRNSGWNEVKEDNNDNNGYNYLEDNSKTEDKKEDPSTKENASDNKSGESKELPEVKPITIGTAYGAVVSSSSIIEDINKAKENNVTKKESTFDRLKARVLYFFAPNRKVSGTEPLSDKIKRNSTIDGPRKIVKKPLRVKAKGLYEKISARVKYFFTRSAKPVLEPDEKDEPTNIEPKTPIRRPIVVPIKDDEPTKNDPSKNDDSNNKDNNPAKNDPSKNDEPTKPSNDDNSNKTNDIIKKQYELLEKEYYLASKLVYNKLGEYEKMFIDDVKAECIDVDNNEFRQMLNERCVNKEAIFNYYCELCELKQLMVMEAFDLLDEYEQSFVDDAIAENLEPKDMEYSQMLSERCVNKNKVNRFIALFKEFRNDQNKVINAAYTFGFNRDYNALTINALRNLTKAHKNELTKGELGKFNASKLTKDELVDILKRSEVNMVKKYVKGE